MSRRRASKAAAATRALHDATAIGALAPLVIAQRMAAWNAAPHGARQQREARRMVAEKQAAAMQMSGAWWLASIQAQQRAWLTAWSAGRAFPLWGDFARSAAGMFARGDALAPVARRVRATARRLARRPK